MQRGISQCGADTNTGQECWGKNQSNQCWEFPRRALRRGAQVWPQLLGVAPATLGWYAGPAVTHYRPGSGCQSCSRSPAWCPPGRGAAVGAASPAPRTALHSSEYLLWISVSSNSPSGGAAAVRSPAPATALHPVCPTVPTVRAYQLWFRSAGSLALCLLLLLTPSAWWVGGWLYVLPKAVSP